MITVTGANLHDIRGQLGHAGPRFDVLIRFRSEDFGRGAAKGGVLQLGEGGVLVEYKTTEELIAALSAHLSRRDKWIDGGCKDEGLPE